MAANRPPLTDDNIRPLVLMNRMTFAATDGLIARRTGREAGVSGGSCRRSLADCAVINFILFFANLEFSLDCEGV